MSPRDRELAVAIIESFDSKPEMLIQLLHGFVDKFGYVSEAAIRLIADELNLSRADVHGVVSYYHDFRTEKPGRHIVKICQAEACQAMGSRKLTEHVERRLGVELHQDSEAVSLQPVYCLGNCACAPAVMIDGKTWGRVTSERFDALIEQELNT
ncbi:MAG: NAD(P)H-dependent oxidoreductase subunit E [Woeseiaceae bacterium]|nr:NAD(P)H-dependent oxidoreductase subunit E [Woeseiaceae bacterium]